MTPKDVLWKLEAHTRGKHEVLRHYLGAWFLILGSRFDRVAFIDGFAGPGQYSGGEAGSPLIAIEAFRPLASKVPEAVFLFIEKDPERAAYLKALVAQQALPPNCKVQCEAAEFERHMTALLDSMRPHQQLAPAFVMLDPFGVSGTPMSILGRILHSGKAELYVSVMYEFIDRFKSTPEFPQHLTDLYGTDAWQESLALEGDAKQEFLLDLYRGQLKKAGAKHVVRLDLYKGARLVYAIFFATKHWLGADKMKQAIWKVVPFGDFAFRGTHHRQLKLGLDADVSALRAQLQKRFRGKGWVTIEQLREFVGSDETDFHTGHLKTPVLVPLEKEGLIEVDPTTRKRARSYPDGTKVRFL